MKPSRAFWIIAGLLFAVASVAIHYEIKIVLHSESAGPVPEMGNVRVDSPAPDFSLQDLANREVTLSSYHDRKVVLMDFWATWCGPCRMAMPGLQKLQDDFKDHSLEVLSIDQSESAEQVHSFLEHRKYFFHVVLDSKGAVGNKYGVRGIPTVVLVDKKGLIRWLKVGYSPEENELRRLVEQLTRE
jgi:cytochrome c biogenesis protein CcmG/thiol:disulfide interchange protein DsbE